MDSLQAQRLARTLACPQCPTKVVIVQWVDRTKNDGFEAICPVDPAHELRMVQSGFRQYLEAWRLGDLDGVGGMAAHAFHQGLRVRAQKHPERWSHDVDERGRITRIGTTYAPWYSHE